jgi:hypothetical protein
MVVYTHPSSSAESTIGKEELLQLRFSWWATLLRGNFHISCKKNTPLRHGDNNGEMLTMNDDEREGVPTRMQALAPNMDENAVMTLAQKVVDCPFHSILAVLIFINGNHRGAHGHVFFHQRCCSREIH